VVNKEDRRSLSLFHEGDATFGKNEAQGRAIRGLQCRDWNSSFTLGGLDFEIPVPGMHNVENAMAAISLGMSLEIPLADCARGLTAFRGVERRYYRVGESGGITVVDDFAHNPAKVRAALETAKGIAHGENRRVLAIFHPHGFAPMKLMGRDIMDAMASALGLDDRVFLAPIYYAGGTADPAISSRDLADHLNRQKLIGRDFSTKEEILDAVAAEARSGDWVISMGARDPDLADFARRLLERLAR
jgi:UDP-N-acetylmuramate--alanine ligase